MATVQNLEVVVDVKIKEALAALTELQDELREVATQIEEVDAAGADGIDVRTNVDELDTELAALSAQIRAFEAGESIDLDTNVDGIAGQAGAAAAARAAGGRPHRLAGMRAQGAGNMGELFDFMGFGRQRDRGPFQQLNDALSNLTNSTRDFDIRMSDIHNLLASLIPLLLVFIGALPAAITALVTLAGAALAAAAAFAVIAGLGALGAAATGGGMPAMEDFEQIWTDIRDAFFEAFIPLAERLEPLFRRGLDGLERFFQLIADEGDALVALSDEAAGFGQFLMNFVPNLLRGLAGLVEAMAPIFGMLGEFLTNNIVNIIRGFVDATLQALPAVIDLVGAIITALPALVRLSIGFTQVSTVIVTFIGIMWDLFTLFGLLNEQAVGVAIASLLTLLTVVALGNKLFAVFSGTAIASAVNALISLVPANILAAESFGALSLGAQIATASLIAFLTVATLGAALALAGAALAAAEQFLGLSSSIDTATSSMRDFNRVSGRAGGSSFNPYGGGGPGGRGTGGGSSGGGMSGGGAGVTINMERTGDKEKDNSDADKAAWRMGRSTGGRP